MGKVRVYIVMKALKQLCSRQLYKSEKICINTNWDQIVEPNSEEMMKTIANDGENEAPESKTKNPTKTLVHAFIESHQTHGLQDRIFEVALDEGQKPLRIFKDEFAKEMNFPTLIFGNPHDGYITIRLSYQKIVQWELLHFSGDFSFHISNMFFKIM